MNDHKVLSSQKNHKLLDIEKEVLIPLARQIIFVKYLVPDLISFLMHFCKDMEFDNLLELVHQAHKEPNQFKQQGYRKTRQYTENIKFEMGTFDEKKLGLCKDEEQNQISQKDIKLTATFGDNGLAEPASDNNPFVKKEDDQFFENKRKKSPDFNNLDANNSLSPNREFDIGLGVRRHTHFNKKENPAKDKSQVNFRKQEFFEQFIKKNLEKNKQIALNGFDIYQTKPQKKHDAELEKNILQTRDDINAKSQQIKNKDKPQKGKTPMPRNTAKFMDSDKKKKFMRGAGLMPAGLHKLVRRDVSPNVYVSKRVYTKEQGIINIDNLHLNDSIMSKQTNKSLESNSYIFPAGVQKIQGEKTGFMYQRPVQMIKNIRDKQDVEDGGASLSKFQRGE